MAQLSEVDHQAVRASPLFRAMPEGVIAPILAASTLERANPRDVLFRQDDPAEYLFLLIEGWLKVTRALPNGQQAVIGLFTRGEALAEAVALTSQPYPACGEAVTEVRYLRVPAETARASIECQPQAALAMISSTAQHLRLLMRQIEQLKARKAPERVVEFLLSLTPVVKGPASFSLPFDKTLMAARLGIQPESLSRAFAHLRVQGVEVQGARVDIAAVESLRLMLDASGDEREPEKDRQ